MSHKLFKQKSDRKHIHLNGISKDFYRIGRGTGYADFGLSLNLHISTRKYLKSPQNKLILSKISLKHNK